jgi:hypothetical protein|nr:MAG TPA: hypothetical protein [Caudoviricetes sp.]
MIIKSTYLPNDSSFQHREEYTFSFDQLNESKLPYIVDRFIYNNTLIESKHMSHETKYGVPMIFGSCSTDTGAIHVGFIFKDGELDYVKNVDITTIKQSALNKLVTYLRDVLEHGKCDRPQPC